MGLIKTAIMTGGGIYAINKLTKATMEHRNGPPPNNNNNNNNQNYRDFPNGDQNYNGNQGYWGPSNQPPRGPPQSNNYNGNYQQQQQQQQWYPSDPVSQDEQYARAVAQGGEAEAQYHAMQRGIEGPPAYNQHPQGQNQGQGDAQSNASFPPQKSWDMEDILVLSI